MAITDDQRAMLQLLLDGGQGYEDIASLLGTEPAEVRRRARAALTDMGGADPDAAVGLTDFLLGQADPIGRADAVRRLQGDPETHQLATRLSAQLRLLSPSAQLPELPEPKGGRRAKAASAPAPAPVSPVPAPAAAPSVPPPPTAPGVPPGIPVPTTPPAAREGRTIKIPALPSLPKLPGRAGGGPPSPNRSRLIAGAGALGVLAIIGILAIAGVFSSGSGSSSSCPTVDPSAALSSGVPAVTLTAADGAPGLNNCQPTGQAVFAQANKQIVLQTNVANLTPTSGDQNYIVWLYRSDDVAFPLAQDTVSADGSLAGPAPIPSQLLRAIGIFSEVRVSLASAAAVKQAIANPGQQGLPPYVGTTVLTGPLPAALTQGASGTQGGTSSTPGGTGSTQGGNGSGGGAGSQGPAGGTGK